MIKTFTKLELSNYLSRLNIGDAESPSLEFLKILQKLHLLNIPFENLDIHYGKSIELDINKIYHKIVLSNRGGFCYELNSLFFVLLKTLGFDTKLISARVYNSNEYGFEFDHMCILVNIEGNEFLSDVGFGEFAFHPLRLVLDEHQFDERGVFYLDKYDKVYLRVNKIDINKTIPQYIFQYSPRELNDFRHMCIYHQTSSKSHFTQNKVVTLPTKNGRITLNSDKLKITHNEKSVETKITDNQQFKEYLMNYFNIDLEKF
jgi:N-hydroxyarylamine O-acetyltransferase